MDNDKFEDITKLMYNNYKRQMILLYFQTKELGLISESFIYALSHNVYPFFHENNEVRIYKNCFSVKKDFIDKVTNYLDQKDKVDDFDGLDFRCLEYKFGYRQYRIELIRILRYCYLDNRFSDTLWNTILSDAPIEAKSITSDFDIDYDIACFDYDE